MNGWTERLQLTLLVQCGGIGFLLGAIFDVFGMIGRCCRETASSLHARRLSVFLTDVLFGVTAALVTFFASLAIMDGRLHPLLFIGSAVGFAVQHICIGRRAGVLLYRICRQTGKVIAGISVSVSGFADRFFSFWRRKIPSYGAKQAKKQKKANIFSKKS